MILVFLNSKIVGPGQPVEASWSLEELASLIQEERLAIVRLDFRGLEVCAYIVLLA